MSSIGLRATPESIAACATADGTISMRGGSNSAGGGDDLHEARIKRRRDDIIGAEAVRLAAISSGDFLRNLLAGKLGERVGGRDLHCIVDRRCPNVERAAEDEGEAEHVVDLIRIIRA